MHVQFSSLVCWWIGLRTCIVGQMQPMIELFANLSLYLYESEEKYDKTLNIDHIYFEDIIL